MNPFRELKGQEVPHPLPFFILSQSGKSGMIPQGDSSLIFFPKHAL